MEAGLMARANDTHVPGIDRTDTDLTREVLHRLRNAAAVPLSVQAEVIDGFIYLRGTVTSPAALDAAESAVCCLTGVKGIVDGILIADR